MAGSLGIRAGIYSVRTRAGCETLGWRFAFPASRSLRFSELLRLTVAVKAVQFLTPSIIQAGEFMKVHLLLESGVKVDIATASVVVAKTTIMIAELLFIALGLSLALGYVAVEPAVALPVTLGLIVMGLCLVGGLFLQRAGLFRPLVWVSRHIRFLAAFIDRHKGLLSSTKRSFRLTSLKKDGSLGHVCGSSWDGHRNSKCAIFKEAGHTSRGAVGVIYPSVVLGRHQTHDLIPGGLSPQEAGTVMTFSSLGLSAESAMAFAVLRRLRQLGWIAVGLGCLTKGSRG